MNNDEAKFILQGYRPSGRDANDSRFAPALAQSRNDPSLGAWFAREQAHDRVVMEKLNEIVPPAGLREKILAGGRVSQVSAPPRRHWGAWLALAASVAVVLTLTEFWQGHRLEAARTNYAEFAVNDLKHGVHHAGTGAFKEEILAMLARDDIRLPGSVPLEWGELEANGCRILKYGDRQTVEICFTRDGQWYHLYMSPRKKSFGSFLKNSPSMLAMNDTAVAVWSDKHYDYVVVSADGMGALKKLTT